MHFLLFLLTKDFIMFTIDGSVGEGGGQMLRSSLALSAICKQPLRLEQIRSKRPKPGLQAQHLCALQAAARVSNAYVEGDSLHSTVINFQPQTIIGGYHEFDIGTAGSCSLVLQTILPMLLHAREQAEIRIRGGTHNPWSPGIDFLQHAFVPLLRKLGVQISINLEAPGFYPRGGGCLHIHIDARNFAGRLDIVERGLQTDMFSMATVARLPDTIAEREQAVIQSSLGLKAKRQQNIRYDDCISEGNFLSVVIEHEHICEVISEPGKMRVPAERIANNVCKQVKRYLKHTAPVGEHLADQLLLPMLLADGGSFVCHAPSLHCTTNADLINHCCGPLISFSDAGDNTLVRIDPLLLT